MLVLGGCAGPLEEATRQDLTTTFVGQRYLAATYLGSRYHLDYTNNSIAERHPTDVFVDQALMPWYETGVEFGSSRSTSIVDALRQIDRDLDMFSFVQGIAPGQMVYMTRLVDRSDRIIVEVESAERYQVRKTYGLSVGMKPQPHAGRIHLMLGKDGMQNLDHALLQRMLDTVIAPLPKLYADAEKAEFILSNFPNTSLFDLMELTGFSEYEVLTRYYTSVLARGELPQSFQQSIADMLARQYWLWFRNDTLLLNDIRAGGRTLVLDYAIQEMSQSVIYHSQELRAAYLFFNNVTRVLKSLQAAISLLADDDAEVLLIFSYPFIDNFGQTFPEETTVRFQANDLIEFAVRRIDEQELARRAEIRVNNTPVSVSLDALKAVERIRLTVPSSWKDVDVDIVDWWYEEDDSEKTTVIRGEIRNNGTWLAKNVTITVEGYNKYGLTEVEESTTLYGFLKPDTIQSFELVIDMTKVERLSRPNLTCQAVE